MNLSPEGIEIDGIPLSEGYGIAVEQQKDLHYLPTIYPVRVMSPLTYRVYLTKRNSKGEFYNLREIAKPVTISYLHKGVKKILAVA